MLYDEAYDKAIDVLLALGAQKGRRQIDVGDNVRVRYMCSGAEDQLPNQGRTGVVRQIILTESALECSTSDLLIYDVQSDDGERFNQLRLSLEKIE